MLTTSRTSRGRIQLHQRDADFTGDVLGDNIVIDETIVEEVQAVEQFSIDIATKKNHPNRIKHMYTHWERLFPKYYRVGVRNLTEEEIMDPMKFFWKNKQDII